MESQRGANAMRSSQTHSIRRSRAGRFSIVSALWIVACVVCISCVAVPRQAHARSYEMGPVNIDATIDPTGLLTVVEDRTFVFDGSFNGVYWDLSSGDFEGNDVVTSVESVGIVEPDGTFTPFTNTYGSEPRTYEVEAWEGTVRVTLFNPADSETVTYRVKYAMQNVVLAWSDVGELYWKFVSDGWDEATNNITCSIHLPVPFGHTVKAGDDVRAWGHGALDGEVTIAQDGVVTYRVPRVGSDDFAEARITFPVGWLHMLSRTQTRLPSVLAEEKLWAEQANARRAAARTFVTIAVGVPILFGVLAVGVAGWSHLSYKRRHRADFQDAYWREAPSSDHPAVIGALVDGGEPGEKEFTATLMRLSDRHVIGLDLVRSSAPGLFREEKREDYRLSLLRSEVLNLEDPIDSGAVGFLFEDVAPKTPTYKRIRKAAERKAGDESRLPAYKPVLSVSEMREVAKEYPGRYMEGLDEWRGTVKAALETRGFYKGKETAHRVGLVICAVLAFLSAVVGFILVIIAESIIAEPVWRFLLFLILPIIGGVLCIVVAARSKSYSDEADEIKAKARALKRWLSEFTHLDEAIPTDVTLWNDLLVYAVVLGVADEVIRQLRVALPQVVDDPLFYPGYAWYVGHGGLGSPMTVVGEAYSASYHASEAAIAASSDSSGGGSGGGFSGGGGGGFGGGGGGGAF